MTAVDIEADESRENEIIIGGWRQGESRGDMCLLPG